MAAQREIAQPKKRAKNVVRDRQMTRERKEKNPDCRRAGFRERIQTPSVGHLGIVILEQLSVGSVTRRERGAAPPSLSFVCSSVCIVRVSLFVTISGRSFALSFLEVRFTHALYATLDSPRIRTRMRSRRGVRFWPLKEEKKKNELRMFGSPRSFFILRLVMHSLPPCLFVSFSLALERLSAEPRFAGEIL